MAALKSGFTFSLKISIILTVAYWTHVAARTFDLIYFTGSFNDRVYYNAHNAEGIVKEETFSLTNPTVFYVHGHGQNFKTVDARAIIAAHLERGDSNVIAVDWRKIAAEFYPKSVRDLVQVGQHLGQAIVTMIEAGMDKDLVHIVGHSLGAQIAGYAGRTAKTLNYELYRLSGLDPAFPLYYILPFATHISPEDAYFVDIIHTDKLKYGAPFSTGTVDFWPNGGKMPQPGCSITDDLCSHQRSCFLWASSVTNPELFLAVNCLEHGERHFGFMGYGATSDLSGDYFLMTSDTPPYGFGNASIETC